MDELGDLLYSSGPTHRYGLRGMSWFTSCDWCPHEVGDHSLILAGAPCLDCDCPGFH